MSHIRSHIVDFNINNQGQIYSDVRLDDTVNGVHINQVLKIHPKPYGFFNISETIGNDHYSFLEFCPEIPLNGTIDTTIIYTVKSSLSSHDTAHDHSGCP